MCLLRMADLHLRGQTRPGKAARNALTPRSVGAGPEDTRGRLGTPSALRWQMTMPVRSPSQKGDQLDDGVIGASSECDGHAISRSPRGMHRRDVRPQRAADPPHLRQTFRCSLSAFPKVRRSIQGHAEIGIPAWEPRLSGCLWRIQSSRHPSFQISSQETGVRNKER